MSKLSKNKIQPVGGFQGFNLEGITRGNYPDLENIFFCLIFGWILRSRIEMTKIPDFSRLRRLLFSSKFCKFEQRIQ